MQQRSTKRATYLRAVPDDPLTAAEGLDFFYSRIGLERGDQRREYQEFVSMKLGELRRVWTQPLALRKLGLPKLTNHEIYLLNVLIFRGRLYLGRLTWTVLRPKQKSLAISLAYEMRTERPHASAALTRLTRMGLLERVATGDRPSVRLTEVFHRLMFEAQWRNELRNSAPEMLDAALTVRDWEWVMRQVDELFDRTTVDYRKLDDRRRVIQDVQRRCTSRA